MNIDDYAPLTPEEVRILIEYRDDHSTDAAWREFNEATRQMDRELAQQTTAEERLLSIGWLQRRRPDPTK